MIWRTPDGPSFSGNYPSSTDVIMRLPRGQRLIPPAAMSRTWDGRLLMAHPQDRLQVEIEELKALHQFGGQDISQKHSKSFWDFLSLRNFILAVGFASIMLAAFVVIIIIFIAYFLPLSLGLTEMVGDKTSGAEVVVHEVAVQGPNSVWNPLGRRANSFVSGSGATLSFLLNVVSAMVEHAEAIAWILLFSGLQY